MILFSILCLIGFSVAEAQVFLASGIPEAGLQSANFRSDKPLELNRPIPFAVAPLEKELKAAYKAPKGT